MSHTRVFSGWLIAGAVVLAVGAGVVAFARDDQAAATQKPNPDLGFTDTPILPGMPWHVHDPARPHPPVVTPGATPGSAPSDATVLFDGKDLSKWAHHGTGANAAQVTPAKWTVRDGYFEVAAGTGAIYSRDAFGDMQLHLEWASPAEVKGNSQGRGNSGIMAMGLYEIQILDTFNNTTYADGQAGAIYGQYPPLANVARGPGQWQTYDIVFEAPRWEGGKLVKAASQTVFWNGVIVHNRKEVMGPMVYRDVAKYTPHEAALPIMLQDHGNPVRFRNIWVRGIGAYQ